MWLWLLWARRCLFGAPRRRQERWRKPFKQSRARRVWSWRVGIWGLATCSSAYSDHAEVGQVKVLQMHCELSPLRDRYAEIIRAVFMRSVRIWDPPVIFNVRRRAGQSEQLPKRLHTLLLGAVALLFNVVSRNPQLLTNALMSC